MKLADFCEMVDWVEVGNQYINVVMPIILTNKDDFKDNEMVGRAKFICSEFPPCEYDFYDEIGIEPETEDGELIYSENQYGWKLVKDIHGNHYVVF